MKARYYITEYRIRRRSMKVVDANNWSLPDLVPPPIAAWWKEHYAIGRMLCWGITARSLLYRTRKQAKAIKALSDRTVC